MKIRFWEALWWGDQPLECQFLGLFKIVTVENLHISSILGPTYPSPLACLHLTTSLSDARAWPLSFLSLFTVKSFFLVLIHHFDPIPFLPTNFAWKSQVPFKVWFFVWLVAHKKVNTNDLLRLRRPYKGLSHDMCKLHMEHRESIDHLFLHCLLMMGVWYKLFRLAKMDWVCSSICDMMIISFKGLGSSRRGLVLCQTACIALI